MSDKIRAASKLLDDFNSFVDNRSTVFLVILPEFFPKFLEWHFTIWEKEYQLLSKKDKLHEWSTYSELSRALDSILKKVEERTLKEGHSFSFFKSFESHVEKHKERFIDGEGGKKFYYVESIIPIFFTTLTENIKKSPESHDIWDHYFPSSWKITKENIQKQENYVSRVLLNNFLHWAQGRMWGSTDKEKFDEVLDDVASNLFPSVEPILWAKLLTFLMRPWANNNRMKSLVEEGTNFGFVSRVMVGDYISAEQSSQELQKHIESQGNATLELAMFLFSREFTKEKLNSFISGLKELKYDKDSREEARRKEFISIFEKMIALHEAKQSS